MSDCDHGMYEYFDALERGEDVYRPHTWVEYDARGIYLARVCEKCEREVLSKYRPDVLTNSSYWADEPIESEDY